jgi:hypothetical protein
MASRKELELRAAAVNIDVTAAGNQNDSVLEQRIIYKETHLTGSSTATQLTPVADAVTMAGGANV